MGWVLYRLGRLDEAIEFLQKALDLRNDPEVAAHLGEVHWVMGNKQAAKTVWESAFIKVRSFNEIGSQQVT